MDCSSWIKPYGFKLDTVLKYFVFNVTLSIHNNNPITQKQEGLKKNTGAKYLTG